SQVVALIDDLEAQGLVQREPDPSDRRTNVVVVTDKGRDLHRSAHEAVRDAERDLHDHLSPEQRELLNELLLLVAFPD
ncbi:MAG: winged helix DNA-binding protein, partial [Lacisediminihabitans sp.]